MTTGEMLHFTNRLKKYEAMQDQQLKDEYLANLQSDIEGIYLDDSDTMIDVHGVVIYQAVVEARQ